MEALCMMMELGECGIESKAKFQIILISNFHVCEQRIGRFTLSRRVKLYFQVLYLSTRHDAD